MNKIIKKTADAFNRGGVCRKRERVDRKPRCRRTLCDTDMENDDVDMLGADNTEAVCNAFNFFLFFIFYSFFAFNLCI